MAQDQIKKAQTEALHTLQPRMRKPASCLYLVLNSFYHLPDVGNSGPMYLQEFKCGMQR